MMFSSVIVASDVSSGPFSSAISGPHPVRPSAYFTIQILALQGSLLTIIKAISYLFSLTR